MKLPLCFMLAVRAYHRLDKQKCVHSSCAIFVIIYAFIWPLDFDQNYQNDERNSSSACISCNFPVMYKNIVAWIRILIERWKPDHHMFP